jgi:hypothetical protein
MKDMTSFALYMFMQDVERLEIEYVFGLVR